MEYRTNDIQKKKRYGYAPVVFIAPAVVFLFVFSFAPILYSFGISFMSYNTAKPTSTIRFVGFKNYATILTDATFLQSVAWTFIFTISVVALNLILSLTLAVLLRSKAAGRAGNVFKSLFSLPMMIAPIVTATIWKLVFSPIYGVLNGILRMLGHPGVNWLSEAMPARIAIIIVEVWATTPLCMLILIAALQTVPQEILEAAKVDGASWIRSLTSIVLPSIRSHISLVITLRFMDAIRMFDIVYNLTNGGPGTSTETLASTIYKTAFRYFDVGTGSAGAFVFFLFIAICSLLFLKFLNPQNDA